MARPFFLSVLLHLISEDGGWAFLGTQGVSVHAVHGCDGMVLLPHPYRAS